MSYVSKYIAKRPERGKKTSLVYPPYQHASRKWRKGRFWGYHNQKCLPLGQKFTGILKKDITIRTASEFAWSIVGTEHQYGNLSFHLFWDAALELYHYFIKDGGCNLYEWEYDFGDHQRGDTNYSPYTSRFSEADLSLISVPTIGRMARPSEASLSQPCISQWLARSSKAGSASRELPYFNESGKVISSR